jgi:hypothetical protein
MALVQNPEVSERKLLGSIDFQLRIEGTLKKKDDEASRERGKTEFKNKQRERK